jgi:hypothetical protein
MTYEIQRAIKFWYQFDDFFNPRFGHISDDIRQAYNYERRLLRLWIKNRVNNTYPQGFISAFINDTQFIEAIKVMAEHQIRIIDDNFQGDSEIELRSFEDFAQGILYDNSRMNTQKIHMMDEKFGYHHWHVFIRAAAFIEDSERWLQIDRNVGLAWAIQSMLRPRQDHHGENPNNLARKDLIDKLRPAWLSRSFDELDNEFDTYDLRRAYGYVSRPTRNSNQ